MPVSKIEWTDLTENYNIRGCTHNCGATRDKKSWCYARRFARRLNYMACARQLKENGISTKGLSVEERKRLYRDTTVWCQDCHDFIPHVYGGKLESVKLPKEPKRIFIDSMWDIGCKDNDPSWLEFIFGEMRKYPQHTFIGLTKRIDIYMKKVFPNNCILGVSYTGRGSVPMTHFHHENHNNKRAISVEPYQKRMGIGRIETIASNYDWIIVGAESGNGKNKVIPEKEWIDDIIKVCNFMGTPLFLKNSLYELYPDLTVIREFPEVKKNG